MFLENRKRDKNARTTIGTSQSEKKNIRHEPKESSTKAPPLALFDLLYKSVLEKFDR